jgi:hypothetical protein
LKFTHSYKEASINYRWHLKCRSTSRQFLHCLRILGAIHPSRSDGLKIGGTCYKEYWYGNHGLGRIVSMDIN